MNIKLILKIVALALLFISIGVQAYIFSIVIYELLSGGTVGFASGIGYGASLPFSIVPFFAALAVIYGAGIKLPMKSIGLSYLGSHLFIIAAMFTFPGKF